MTASIDGLGRMPASGRDQLSEAKLRSASYAEGQAAAGDLCGTVQLLVREMGAKRLQAKAGILGV